MTSSHRWFETPSRLLWHHCNVFRCSAWPFRGRGCAGVLKHLFIPQLPRGIKHILRYAGIIAEIPSPGERNSNFQPVQSTATWPVTIVRVHYSDVTMTNKSPQITYPQLFVQPFVWANIKETSKPALLVLCEENSPVTGEFPSQRASNAEMFLFDDVIM